MEELNRLKIERKEAFAKYIHHQALAQKHEQSARQWRYRQLDLSDEIRALERELSAPIKVVYGRD